MVVTEQNIDRKAEEALRELKQEYQEAKDMTQKLGKVMEEVNSIQKELANLQDGDVTMRSEQRQHIAQQCEQVFQHLENIKAEDNDLAGKIEESERLLRQLETLVAE